MAATAADEALRTAMAAADYEGLRLAIETHCAMASEGTLTEARAVRERLHKKRKKESRKLQQKHALEMEVQAGLSALSMADDGSQPPQDTAAAPSTADAAASPAGSPAAVASEPCGA